MIRGQVEQYGEGKIKHFHVIVYAQNFTELGLAAKTVYMVSFTQNGKLFLQTKLLLESYVGNSYHFRLLKNQYIRNGLLKVNEWYDLQITRLAGA